MKIKLFGREVQYSLTFAPQYGHVNLLGCLPVQKLFKPRNYAVFPFIYFNIFIT